MMYCVTVIFEVRAGDFEGFATRTRQQADDSLSAEPGCLTFDVWTSASRLGIVYLYEIYTDRQAFDNHLRSTHFAAFDKEVAPRVLSKTVETWERKI